MTSLSSCRACTCGVYKSCCNKFIAHAMKKKFYLKYNV